MLGGPWMIPGREEGGWEKAVELAKLSQSLWASPAPTGHPDLGCKWAMGLMSHSDGGHPHEQRA